MTYKVTIITCAVVVNWIVAVSCVPHTPVGPIDVNKIFQQAQDIAAVVHKIINDPAPYVNAFSEAVCEASKGGSLTAFIDASMNELLREFSQKYKKLLADVKIHKLPNFSHKFSDKIDITEFTLTDIEVKGLDHFSLENAELNLCKLSSQFNVKVPNVDMTAKYTLKGVVDGSPVTGGGHLKLSTSGAYVYEESLMECIKNLFTEVGCSTIDFTVKTVSEKLTVNFSGVKYKHLTESQINHNINNYIVNHILSAKSEFMQDIYGQLPI